MHVSQSINCHGDGGGSLLSMWLYDEARECASESVVSALVVKFIALGPDIIELVKLK
jgi:hypothetical protein